MKKPVKRLVIVFTVIMVLVGVVCLRLTKNQRILNGLMREFKSTVFEYAEIVETESVYGKLIGNGNGIQYFGCALIRNDPDLDIDALVEKLDAQFEEIDYYVQENCDVYSKNLEHARLKYDTPIGNNAEYISICFFNSWHPDSNLNDIRGH